MKTLLNDAFKWSYLHIYNKHNMKVKVMYILFVHEFWSIFSCYTAIMYSSCDNRWRDAFPITTAIMVMMMMITTGDNDEDDGDDDSDEKEKGGRMRG